MRTSLPLAALLAAPLAACSLHAAHAQPRSDPPLPPPATLCLLAPGAAPRVVVATPSRAGTYDPHEVPRPELLNWMVPGVGCVRWPAATAPRVACGNGGAPLPPTERTLCGQ